MSKAKRLARNHEALHDKTGLTILCRKPVHELRQMESTGEAIRACRRCGGTGHLKRCNGKVQPHDMVWAATDMFKNTHVSAAYITEADMLANVGIAGKPDEGPKRGRIKAAQAKIREYGRLEAKRMAGVIKTRIAERKPPFPVFYRDGDDNFETPFGDVPLARKSHHRVLASDPVRVGIRT